MKTLIIFLIVSAAAYSQEVNSKNNIIYAELLGNGIYSSLNYETTFTIAPTAAIGYRYSPKDGGFFLSAALDIFPEPAGKIFPWGGLGLGYSF